MADVQTVPVSASSLRDTILSALMSSGNADFFSLPAGLTLRLEASTTDPFIVNVGGKEYTFSADIDLTLTDTAHNFVFLDIAGTLSREAIPPIYSYSTPGGPATGQYWYDLGKRQMKRYDGAAFVNVNRIYVGYARADAAAINARYACEPVGLDPYTRFMNFGDGSDGFLDASAGTTTIDGLKKYTAVVIRGSATVQHTANTSRVLVVYAQTVLINLSSNGVVLNGLGKAAGAGGTGAGAAGSGTSHGGSGGGGGGGTGAGGAGASFLGTSGSNNFSPGAAGGAGGGAGGNGTASTFASFPRAAMIFTYGNGGGGGGGDGSAGGNGGAGGGSIAIIAPCIANASGGSIVANGNNGAVGPAANRGGGGGAGGGILILVFRNHFNSGTETVTGGTGGASGGAGSGAGGNGGAGVLALERV